jgi:hypothetical protein
MRKYRRTAFGVCGALASFHWISLESRAFAQDANVAVTVDCPPLGDEQRAALDARARAELLVRHASGSLSVTCADGANAVVSWHPSSGGGEGATKNLPLTSDPPAMVDLVLGSLDALIGGDTPQSSSAATPPVIAPVAPVASVASPMPGAPVLPMAPVMAPPFYGAPPRAVHPARAQKNDFLDTFVSVGVAVDFWSSSIGGGLGPRAAVRVVLPEQFAVDAGGELLFGLAMPDAVAGLVGRLYAGGEYDIDDDRQFRAGVDLDLDVVHLSPDASTHASGATKVLPAATLRFGYAPPLVVPIVFGPTLTVHTGPLRADINGAEAFSIPTFSVGLFVEGDIGPL